jgi:hypothetical protein
MASNCGFAAYSRSVRAGLAFKGLLDPPRASTEPGGYKLLERKLDSLFFLAGHELISLDDPRASVPAQ